MKSNNINSNVIRSLLVIFLILIHFEVSNSEPNRNINNFYYLEIAKNIRNNIRIEKIKESDFSLSLLEEYISLRYPESPNIPLYQFILETGWFTSKLFINHNNLSGMKLPSSRRTKAIGEFYGHSSYLHWTDSVDDYYLWLSYYKNKGYSVNNYYLFLNIIGYAEDPRYILKLKSIERNYAYLFK